MSKLTNKIIEIVAGEVQRLAYAKHNEFAKTEEYTAQLEELKEKYNYTAIQEAIARDTELQNQITELHEGVLVPLFKDFPKGSYRYNRMFTDIKTVDEILKNLVVNNVQVPTKQEIEAAIVLSQYEDAAELLNSLKAQFNL